MSESKYDSYIIHTVVFYDNVHSKHKPCSRFSIISNESEYQYALEVGLKQPISFVRFERIIVPNGQNTTHHYCLLEEIHRVLSNNEIALCVKKSTKPVQLHFIFNNPSGVKIIDEMDQCIKFSSSPSMKSLDENEVIKKIKKKKFIDPKLKYQDKLIEIAKDVIILSRFGNNDFLNLLLSAEFVSQNKNKIIKNMMQDCRHYALKSVGITNYRKNKSTNQTIDQKPYLKSVK